MNLSIFCVYLGLFLTIIHAGGFVSAFENDFQNGKSCGIVIENALRNGEKLPWISTLYTRTEEEPDETNPAILLTPSLVLMNANRFERKGLIKVLRFFNLSSYSVSANLSDFGTTHADRSTIQTVKVKQIRLHPNFTGDKWQNYQNDVALLHLSTPFKFDSTVHAICIPTPEISKSILKFSRDEPEENSESSILLFGWKRNNMVNKFLRMKIINQETCYNWWISHEDTRNYSINYVHRFCANVSKDNSHQDCINKDNGMVGKYGDRYYFLGLVNNFHSDNRICTSKARFFVMDAAEDSILKFINNNIRCGPDNFTCSNGECISLKNWCDGSDHCGDNSDETDLHCEAIMYPDHCVGNEFQCGPKGKCIPFNSYCDGKKDCRNGEDELGCESNIGYILGGIATCLILLLLIFGALWKRLIYLKKAGGDLTDDEVLEFFKGIQIPVDESERGTRFYENDPAARIPWDNSKFEIPKEKLDIQWDGILGKGAFGVVHRAVYEVDDSAMTVATKSFKSSEGKAAFMSQLSELKVMTRLGTHDHIVNLIGAYTKEIQKRILYIVVELCPMGDLESYLKDNREEFIDLIDRDGNYNGKSSKMEKMTITLQNRYENFNSLTNSKNLDSKEPLQKSFTTLDLLLWSHQIASAMEYLSSKNVNHGDLATRNILLTEDYNAKVSDFGLSIHLYSTGAYKKRDKDTPLPWRWMAIESIKDLKFSTKSDIWSYGVTIWEIFSLGLVPYPGLYYDFNFIENLENGLRLGEPSNGSHEVYAVMVHCWNLKPELRPSFTYLKDLFYGLYEILERSVDEREAGRKVGLTLN